MTTLSAESEALNRAPKHHGIDCLLPMDTLRGGKTGACTCGFRDRLLAIEAAAEQRGRDSERAETEKLSVALDKMAEALVIALMNAKAEQSRWTVELDAHTEDIDYGYEEFRCSCGWDSDGRPETEKFTDHILAAVVSRSWDGVSHVFDPEIQADLPLW